MKKVKLLLATSLVAVALAGCGQKGGGSSAASSQTASSSATSSAPATTSVAPSSSSSTTSTTPEPTDWSAASKKVFNDTLFFELPYIVGAEAELFSAGIVTAEGTKAATAADVVAYGEALEEYGDLTWEEDDVQYRCSVYPLTTLSADAEYYFALDEAAEVRLVVEYYETDPEYEDWYSAYYVEQFVYYGLTEDSTLAFYSVVSYNLYSTIFGIQADGSGAYQGAIYSYFDVATAPTGFGMNNFAFYTFQDSKTTSKFDGSFVTPSFASGYLMVADYDFIMPFTYGNNENPIFGTRLGMINGTEQEHDDYISAILTAGYTENPNASAGTRQFVSATTNGYAVITVSDYDAEKYEFSGGTKFPGYDFTCVFQLNAE